MARLAAIDIGSNAIRLRIVDVDPPVMGPEGARFYPFKDVHTDRASVRLGHDVFTKGHLEPEVIGAACEALKRFRGAMDDAKVERYRAVATSAAREASNGDILVERAEREAGVHVEVIEGVEEARLVQMAVLERVTLTGRTALLIDIGGGSTELTLLRGKTADFTRSLPVGTVRLIESFLEGKGPVSERQRRLLEEYVGRVSDEALREIRAIASGPLDMLVGTGGNIETLADLCPIPSAFPESRAIEVSAMRRLLDELSAASLDERIQRFGLRADRADTIIPAATVLHHVASACGSASIMAPGVGLKEGLLVDLAHVHFLPHDFGAEAAAVTDACVRLGRRYRFDEQHGALVARFSVRLFDDLAARHRMRERDRILLHAAALLHDVGDFVRYEGHHKHSYYVIAHSELMGITPQERALVANVARYHRKSPPHVDHENFRALSREDRTKVKSMAAILRVADALDRQHQAKVSDITSRVEGSTLVIEMQGAGDHTLGDWTVGVKSGMLRDAFGLDVRLVDVGPKPASPEPPPPASSTTPPPAAPASGAAA
jgi:exopolyphosphatase/guanosine-5'-triphosphate,3'-diphosphate pyrophosphatase